MGVDLGKLLVHILDVLRHILHARSTTGGPCALVVIVFILFSLGSVGCWMSLLTPRLALLVPPVIIVVGFIIHAYIIISASSAVYSIGISLCKLQCFRFNHFGYSYLALFIQEM